LGDVQRRDNLDWPIRRELVVDTHGFVEFDAIVNAADDVVVEFLFAYERNTDSDIAAW
jgi:hypothetical protein